MMDTDLIIRCQQGEEAAFDALYSVVYKKTLRTVFLLAGYTDKVEDIIQDTFYECFRDIGKLRNPELFQAWFNRILVRKCHRSAWENLPEQSLDSYEEIQLRNETSVSDIAERNQNYLIVREAINKLKSPLRTTVILFYYNDMSIKEIAGIMNCFQGTVKSRLHYAKKVLEKELKRDFAEERSEEVLFKPEEGSVYE